MASTTMLSPRALNKLYVAQHNLFSDIFRAEDVDSEELCLRIDFALNDGSLPAWYVAKFHAMRAWHSDDPEGDIERAKQATDKFRRLRLAAGKSKEDIAFGMSWLEAMIRTFERALASISKADDLSEALPPVAGFSAVNKSPITADADAKPRALLKQHREYDFAKAYAIVDFCLWDIELYTSPKDIEQKTQEHDIGTVAPNSPIETEGPSSLTQKQVRFADQIAEGSDDNDSQAHISTSQNG